MELSRGYRHGAGVAWTPCRRHFLQCRLPSSHRTPPRRLLPAPSLHHFACRIACSGRHAITPARHVRMPSDKGGAAARGAA